jgi:hypothetical protein
MAHQYRRDPKYVSSALSLAVDAGTKTHFWESLTTSPRRSCAIATTTAAMVVIVSEIQQLAL